MELFKYKLLKYILFIFLLFLSYHFAAGQDSSAYIAFHKHLNLAKQYEKAALYAESIEEATIALKVAEENNLIKLAIESGIFLAETQRKTGDFLEGLGVLRKLNSSINYPELHIKKLGRIAATLNSLAAELTNELEYRDSVLFYLDSALTLASKFQLKELQAGLFNELGYTLGAINTDSSLFYLNKAATLFMELGDTANYVVARTNLMRAYIQINNLQKVEIIIEEVIAMTQKESFTSLGLKLELYRTLTYYYSEIGDCIIVSRN